MQSVVEVVHVDRVATTGASPSSTVGNNSTGGGTAAGGKTYNAIYTDPGYCKMVIVQDDEKFPSPRLCLLRKWPNFEGGFGFHLFEDLLNSTGALKIENVTRGSPAEAGGLRANDVIIEINGDNIEYKSFFRLIEILKDAFSQHEMELLVLAELDAEWYRARNICVNSNFPNIEYCETPYYGHKFKPLDLPTLQGPAPGATSIIRVNNPQIEFHSSSGKLYRTTLVIDKNKDTVYRRIEELPGAESQQQAQQQQQSGETSTPTRVYYRKGYGGLQEETLHTMMDSGHGSMSARRSTPISTTYSTTMGSPYSTIGKSCGEQVSVDLLHDKWAELMDKYLDNKYRSAEDSYPTHDQQQQQQQGTPSSISKRSHVIMLNSGEAAEPSKRSRSAHATSGSEYYNPNGSFSFLFSGRDDYNQRRSQSPQPANYYARTQSPQTYHRQSIPQTRFNLASSPTRTATTSANTTPTSTASSRGQSNKYQSKSDTEKITSTTTYEQQTTTSRKQRESSSSPYRSAAPHSIIVRPKVLSQSLGFQLDENELIRNNSYYVKYVELGSASSIAGLKDGDKITKINGKSTQGMSYDEFCNEIIISQQQQQHNKNNMIHLMVMRKSNKSAQAAAAAAAGVEQSSSTTAKTTLTMTPNVPTYSTLSTTTSLPIHTTSAPSNLVSVIKVTSPTTTETDKPVRGVASTSSPVHSSTASVSQRPNVIYTHHVKEEVVDTYTTYHYEKHDEQTTTRTTTQVPTSDKQQASSNVTASTLSTQPPSVKSPFAVLSKISVLADNEKTAAAASEIKIEREQPAPQQQQEPVVQQQPPVKKPPRADDSLVSQTVISSIHESTSTTVQRPTTPSPSEYPDHESIKPSEGTTIPNTNIDMTEAPPVRQQQQQPAEKPHEASSSSIPAAVITSSVQSTSPSSSQSHVAYLKSKLRGYHIDRNPEYFGFGIILHTDKDKEQENDNILLYPSLEIEKGSPASVSGLQTGQRLVAVNGKFINKDFKTINSLAQAIDDSYYQRGSTDFLVLDEQVWEDVKDEQLIMSALSSISADDLVPVQVPQQQQQQVAQPPSKPSPIVDSSSISQNDKIVPRFCRLQRDTRDDQYGFDFKTLKTEGKHIATNVRDGYPAQRAGLRNGDYIIEVNGRSIEGIEHEAVVNLIFSNVKQVDLLVVEDLKGYKKARKQQEKLMSQVAATRPHIERSRDVSRHRIHLLPTYKGLGLHLNVDGVINYIEPSSPAELAGLRKDQKIVEVNDINVRGKTNREIAAIIKENMNDLVIGVEGDMTPTRENVIDADEERDNVLPSLVETNPIVAPSPVTPRIRPVDENIFLQSKAVSENAINVNVVPSAASPSLSKGKSPVSSSTSKLSSHGGGGNLTKNIKNKFGSCLGLNTVPKNPDLVEINNMIDDLNAVRVCNLISRPDFMGYGFSLRKNEAGPHQIANVEGNSPALISGLQDDDYLLKINDTYVVGERYSKTVTRIKNESEKGILKLEVVEPEKCPRQIREARIDIPSGYASVSSSSKLSPIMSKNSKKKRSKTEADVTDAPAFSGSVRSVPEYMNVAPATSKRPSSASPAVINEETLGRQQQGRPFSMNDLDNIDPKSTVKSYDSATTGFSTGALNLSGNITSGSVRSVPNLPYTSKNTPKFKRCTVIAIPNFKGFGFTINNQIKPKYMIYDIEQSSPADLAGLRRNDVIIEVNNKNIRRTSFEKVRMLLSDAYIVGKVELLVISKDGYAWFKARKKKFSTKLTNENNVELFSNIDSLSGQPTTQFEITEPRVQRSGSNAVLNETLRSIESTSDREIFNTVLRRRDDYQGFGISLATNKHPTTNDEKSNVPVITSVEPRSPGEDAGLRKNDLILEINGKSTYKQSSELIANSIRSSGNEARLVISREKSSSALATPKLPAAAGGGDVHISEEETTLEFTRTALSAATIGVIKSQNNRALDKESITSTTEERRSSRISLNNDKQQQRSRSASPKIISSAMTMSSSKIYPSDSSPSNAGAATRTRNQSAPPSPSVAKSDAPVPRLCRVRTYESSLGFVVAGSKTKSGIYKVTDITPNSPAYNSGLRNDDYIIEVSGVNVEKLSYQQLIDLIKEKKEEDDLQMLVADRTTLEWYKSRDTSISSRLVPKLTYIETLLQDELQFNLTDSLTNTTHRLSQESLTALEKIATNSKFIKKSSSDHGESSSYIIRKVYL